MLDGEQFFITDSRYELDAKLNIKNCQIIISNDLIKSAKKILKNSSIKKLYFDPFDLDVATFFELSKNLNISFIEKPYFSKKSRIIKTNLEIKFIGVITAKNRRERITRVITNPKITASAIHNFCNGLSNSGIAKPKTNISAPIERK